MKSGFIVTKRDVIEVKKGSEANRSEKNGVIRERSAYVGKLTPKEINESWHKAVNKK